MITTYYGMNFPLAAYRWKHGRLYVLELPATLAGGTWWYVRRRRWL